MEPHDTLFLASRKHIYRPLALSLYVYKKYTNSNKFEMLIEKAWFLAMHKAFKMCILGCSIFRE